MYTVITYRLPSKLSSRLLIGFNETLSLAVAEKQRVVLFNTGTVHIFYQSAEFS